MHMSFVADGWDRLTEAQASERKKEEPTAPRYWCRWLLAWLWGEDVGDDDPPSPYCLF